MCRGFLFCCPTTFSPCLGLGYHRSPPAINPPLSGCLLQTQSSVMLTQLLNPCCQLQFGCDLTRVLPFGIFWFGCRTVESGSWKFPHLVIITFAPGGCHWPYFPNKEGDFHLDKCEPELNSGPFWLQKRCPSHSSNLWTGMVPSRAAHGQWLRGGHKLAIMQSAWLEYSQSVKQAFIIVFSQILIDLY